MFFFLYLSIYHFQIQTPSSADDEGQSTQGVALIEEEEMQEMEDEEQSEERGGDESGHQESESETEEERGGVGQGAVGGGDNVIVDVDVHGNDNVVDVNVERDGKGGHNLRNLGRKDGGK